MKKMFMNTGNQDKNTLEADRYSEPPPQFQDSLFNYRQRTKYEITSLKEVFQSDINNNNDLPIKSRKDTDLT
jgi:hypothetical protein